MLCKLLQHNAVASMCSLTDPRPPPFCVLIKQYDANETWPQNKPTAAITLYLRMTRSFFRKRGPHGVARRPRSAFRRQRLWSFQWIQKQTATWQCGDVPLYSLPRNWFGFVFACCPFATASRVQTAALIAAKLLFVWMWWMDVSHLSPSRALICGLEGEKSQPSLTCSY